MPAEFDLKLRDGIVATVSISVKLATQSDYVSDRAEGLENFLTGMLAGVAPKYVGECVIGYRTSADVAGGGGS